MSRPAQPEPRAKESKPWLCGDSYRYPLPKPDGDAWELLLQPYLKKDNAQCEAWKNEIHYLLLFAGLFSVVMTIFVLHSTQSLQQSPTDATLNMLATMMMSNLNTNTHLSRRHWLPSSNQTAGAPSSQTASAPSSQTASALSSQTTGTSLNQTVFNQTAGAPMNPTAGAPLNPTTSAPLNQPAGAPFNPMVAATVFSPTRSHVHISILWFISLILCLTVLIAGVVILQWIREHQLYTDDISSKEAVSVYHMRVEAWKKWRVPQIISFLPLLLLFAVVLFFAGIIVYLFTLNRTVAIAVTVIISITLFLLLLTTLLPTIQCFILSLSEPSRTKDIPAQCPYKSPQAWFVYRLFAWVFRYTFALGWRMRYIPIAFFVRRRAGRYSWMTFDAWWLTLRSTYAQFIHGVFTPGAADGIDALAPGYDESRVLVHAMQHHSHTSKTVLAAYHAFAEVSRAALHASDDKELEDISSSLRRRNQLLHLLYWNGVQYGKLTAASNRLDAAGVQKMHDENMMLFLWLPDAQRGEREGDRDNAPYPDVIARGLASHMLELQTRHMQYVMVQGSLEDSYFSDDREKLWMTRIYQQYRPTNGVAHFGPWQYALHRRVSKDVAEASVEQYTMVFDSFVRKYASDAGQAWTLKDLQSNSHGRAILEDFLSVATILQTHLFTSSSESSSTYSRRFRETLIYISTILETSWTYTEVHERHDFLFYAITYTLTVLLSSTSTDILQYIPIELLRSLSRYEVTVDKAAWQATFSGNYTIGDWTTRLAEIEKVRTFQGQNSTLRQLLVQSPTIPEAPSTSVDILAMPLVTPISPLVLPTKSESSQLTVSRSDEGERNGSTRNLAVVQQTGQIDAGTNADTTLINFEDTTATTAVGDSLDENANERRTGTDAQGYSVVTTGQRDVRTSDSQTDSQLQSLNSRQVQSEETSRSDVVGYSNQQQFQGDEQNAFNNSNIERYQSEQASRSDVVGYYNQQQFQGDEQNTSNNLNLERYQSEQTSRSDVVGYSNQQEFQGDEQTALSNSERYDSSLTQRVDFNNTTDRTDTTTTTTTTTMFNNRRVDYQDTRFNSFTSSQYDTTNVNYAWMYNRGESWSNSMSMDQSWRSSQVVEEMEGHEGVEGNLFY